MCGFRLDGCNVNKTKFGDGVGRYGKCERSTSELASVYVWQQFG